MHVIIELGNELHILTKTLYTISVRVLINLHLSIIR